MRVYRDAGAARSFHVAFPPPSTRFNATTASDLVISACQRDLGQFTQCTASERHLDVVMRDIARRPHANVPVRTFTAANAASLGCHR